MVCPRCVMAVESILHNLSVPFIEVAIGEVTLDGPLPPELQTVFETELNKIGFETVTDPKGKLLEQVRLLVREYIDNDSDSKVNLSVWLSAKLGYDYTYLSNVFSAATGSTIEKFYITQRIEKAKELLKHHNFSVTDVAQKLGYSSGAYLSSQFKKHTGLTPGMYKSSVQGGVNQ